MVWKLWDNEFFYGNSLPDGPNSIHIETHGMDVEYSFKVPWRYVFVEVLLPSQPNEIMLSGVNLPNHTFTGQA